MNNCKYCKADCALRGEENLKKCKGHIHMSNADRIRAMSDEELAKHLVDIGWDCLLLDNDPLLRVEKCNEKCAEHCLQWLQQPAEIRKEDA